MKMITSLAIASILSSGAFAVEFPPPVDRAVEFSEVQQIMRDNCIKCHGEEKVKSDLKLNTKEDAMKGGTDGPCIIPGNSAGSLLIALCVSETDDFEVMPNKGDLLTPEQIGVLRTWIDKGAEWPEGVVIPEPEPEFPIQAHVENLPEDWVVEATGQKGPLAKWELNTSDLKGPDGEPSIVLSEINDETSSTYNLLWTPKRQFENGSISVLVKALSGEDDQGGGVMWRVKDKDNYYVARYNPLEKNFRSYVVIEGRRKQIISVDVEADAKAWNELRIEQDGNNFTGYLNGVKLLEATDDRMPGAGGVGYWTKADASTAFCRSKIEPK